MKLELEVLEVWAAAARRVSRSTAARLIATLETRDDLLSFQLINGGVVVVGGMKRMPNQGLTRETNGYRSRG